MLRSFFSWLPFVRDAGGESGDGDDSESGFRPSRLDASVLSAHGMDVERVDEETVEIDDHARELEEARRRDR